ncbi:hypothetical protein YA49_18710 [Enterobacter cloacae subsp. cloacae]|uniref:helix-turn-helix transcriptional regulator n=1 Tax=Enterobacter cloacae TaxID=550 RepID=UPI00063A86A3|nr:LuxR C-terminal-related transcriptional regulator [Enterobacter cloacae]KLG05707.1 hypothetical protein YA49_18710 [Enterobacter cloacae subsp. cloacae]
MIYVITENIFLKNGITSALYPMLVEFIPVHEYDHSVYASIASGDVVLIDTHLSIHAVLSKLAHYSRDIKIVFLNNDKLRKINFGVLYSSSWMIDARVPLDELRISVLKVITEHYKPSSCRNSLSYKETYVLLESMKGTSVQDIARESGINEKTIYHNRKSACRKLGVNKVWEVLPYSHLMTSPE